MQVDGLPADAGPTADLAQPDGVVAGLDQLPRGGQDPLPAGPSRC